MTETKKNIYHYTTGKNLAAILRSGEILPSCSFASASEKAVVWCSTRDDWEPSATCLQNLPDGRIRYRSVEEIRRSEGGLARIRTDGNIRTFTWEQYVETGNIPVRMFSDFIARCGADPEEWRVCFTAIPKNFWLAVEVQDAETHRWTKHPLFYREELRDLLLRIRKAVPAMTADERKACLGLLESLQKRYVSLKTFFEK